MEDNKVSVKEALDKLYDLSWMVGSTAMEYLTDKDHALRTSKADTSQHGFGLLNVQKTVEAANGIIDITKNSTSFCVTILIPEK